MATQTIKKGVLVAILLCIAIVAAFGYIDRVVYISGMGSVSKANTAYLDTAFDRSLAGFLILSGIKSGLAVIEGSEVGKGLPNRLCWKPRQDSKRSTKSFHPPA
jgi:hypothetical protein